jgi:hypothetical protein
MSCLSVKRRSNVVRWCRFRAFESRIFKDGGFSSGDFLLFLSSIVQRERTTIDLLAIGSMIRPFSSRATLEEAALRALAPSK